MFTLQGCSTVYYFSSYSSLSWGFYVYRNNKEYCLNDERCANMKVPELAFYSSLATGFAVFVFALENTLSHVWGAGHRKLVGLRILGLSKITMRHCIYGYQKKEKTSLYYISFLFSEYSSLVSFWLGVHYPTFHFGELLSLNLASAFSRSYIRFRHSLRRSASLPLLEHVEQLEVHILPSRCPSNHVWIKSIWGS